MVFRQDDADNAIKIFLPANADERFKQFGSKPMTVPPLQDDHGVGASYLGSKPCLSGATTEETDRK